MASTMRLPLGFTVGCKRLAAGDEIPWHDHGMATLCVVFAGRAEEEDRRQVRVRRTGDLVFRPEPERHRNVQREGAAHILTLEVQPRVMEMVAEAGLPRSTTYAQSRRAVQLARQAQVALRSDGAAGEIELTGLAFELLSAVARGEETSSRPPVWITRVHDRLRSDLRATPRLEELAREASVSVYQLSRAFRRHFGKPVGAFVREARVEAAMRLLAESERSLAEVALEAGFYDQSHLTLVFKRHTGRTPAEFRRRSVAARRA